MYEGSLTYSIAARTNFAPFYAGRVIASMVVVWLFLRLCTDHGLHPGVLVQLMQAR